MWGERQRLDRRQLVRTLGAGGLVLATGGLAGCTEEGAAPTEAEETTVGDEGTTAGGDEGGASEAWTAALDADREVWIAMGDLAGRDTFFPSTTVVEAGEEVGVHLRNNGDETHDMDIEAFGVEQEVEAGGVTSFTFTADQPGVHPIVCELHPTWMYGQLVVLPESGTPIPTRAEEGRELRVAMGDVAGRDSFVPSTNVVVEGEEVSVTLANNGDEPHDLDIEAFDVEQEVEEGGQTEFGFTADQPGIYPIVCELHPTWMYGQLVVLPADGDFSRVAAAEDRALRIAMGDVVERESFFPSTSVVKAGEEVSVTLANNGDETHDMDIEAFDVEVDVEAESQTEFSFTADEAGIYPIVCELHPPEMVGQLLVLP